MSGKYPGGIVTAGAPAGYSVYFDGAGDYLSVADNAAFELNGDFTIEGWFYLTNTVTTEQDLIGKWYSSGNFSYLLYVLSGGLRFSWTSNGSTTNTISGGTVSLNTWFHAAISGNAASGTVRLFLNGVQVATQSAVTLYTSGTAPVYVMADNNSGTPVYTTGYASNVRILKGTNLYTAAFTPPTQLFNITNTSLLTCNSPAIVDQGTANSGSGFTITANGNAAVSTFTPFTGYSATPPNPNTQSNTSGIWTVTDAEYWMAQNKWPMPYPRQSLRFNSADSAYLNRTPSVAGNRKTWTWSGWVKRTSLGTAQSIFGSSISGSATQIFFDSSDRLWLYGSISASVVLSLVSTSVYRDVSAWYNIQVMLDTTQATAANRARMWVNGVELTAFSTATYPAQNTDMLVNTTNAHNIGRDPFSGSNLCNFYLADTYFIDGTALTTASFGQTDANTGAWIPQNYTGSYGTNGFRLTFQNNTGTTATTLGKDWSGVGNNWTPNNFSVAAGVGNDSLTDSPWNFGTDYGNGGEVRGNYATFNSLTPFKTALTNGNLQSGTGDTWSNSTIGMSSGKWYAEFTLTTFAVFQTFGVGRSDPFAGYNGQLSSDYAYYNDGTKVNNAVFTAYGASFTSGDIISVAFDADAGSLTFYKNGVSQGVAFSSMPAGTYYFQAYGRTTGGSTVLYANFGQRPFAYKAPSGYKALCTTNLPTPAIGATSTTLANSNFETVLWTGNSSQVTVGFDPDLLWYKARNAVSYGGVVNVITGDNVYLQTYTTGAETTQAGLLTTNSTGFIPGTVFSTNNYVAWNWKAGGAGVTNTAGSVTSTVSANTTAGFSVVTFTAPASGNITVGHGLGVTPAMVIVKSRSNGTANWYVWHKSLSSATNSYVELNTTIAAASVSTMWGTSGANSTTLGFTTGNSIIANATEVAYVFAEISGFSKFGSYTGNASADGPFVYCGFRPRFFLWKPISSVGSWAIYDSARNTYNVEKDGLYPNLTNAEADFGSTYYVDFLSNGFKIRGSGSGFNGSGETIIFAAFAETPFNYSRAR